MHPEKTTWLGEEHKRQDLSNMIDIELADPTPSRRRICQAFDSPWNYQPAVMLHFKTVALVILPTPLRAYIAAEEIKPERLHPTAYLDGLRGCAAFAVFLCHMSYTVFSIAIGYNKGDDPANRSFLYLPIIRLLFSGPAMVALFFVISGYALSYKPLKQMRTGQYGGLLETLSSSVFRRAFRLFLPCFASTFLVFVLVRCGAYEATRSIAESDELLRNYHEFHMTKTGTFQEQFWDWAYESFDFIHVWAFELYGGSTPYDHHLWTIPLEFRSSFVLFLTHLCLARVRSGIRLSLLFLLCYWAYSWDRWEMILFWAGCFIAELDLIRLANSHATNVSFPLSSFASVTSTFFVNIRSWGQRILWTFLFLSGLYILSYPDIYADLTPGYKYLFTFEPARWAQKYRFWQWIGAILVVFVIANAPLLQRPFTCGFIQYLGKISFALYLMHGPVLHTFGYWCMDFMWSLTGTETEWRFRLGFALASAVNIVAVLWAADLFWRTVDLPCVRFARWVEGKCLVTH